MNDLLVVNQKRADLDLVQLVSWVKLADNAGNSVENEEDKDVDNDKEDIDDAGDDFTEAVEGNVVEELESQWQAINFTRAYFGNHLNRKRFKEWDDAMRLVSFRICFACGCLNENQLISLGSNEIWRIYIY